MRRLITALRRRQLDEKLSPLANFQRLPHGFIHELREALEMSSYQLADRLGVSQSTVMDLERSERQGTITVKSLERAAEALGCQFVYALVPRTSLEQIVDAQAKLRARQLSSSIFRTMALEQQSAGSSENEVLIERLVDDVLRNAKRELWKREV
jgi:predicted DNA-binding mobile mystery protein A